MKAEVITAKLATMVRFRPLRKILLKRIDRLIYQKLVEESTEDLQEVSIRKYQYFSAMLRCIMQNVNRGYVSKKVIRKILDVLVGCNFVHTDKTSNQIEREYEQKFGELPPSFIVFSPTQKCNLKCIGCYAASNPASLATIPFQYVDKVMNEVHDTFGNRFTTISGGEPFMYRSQGKTLLDIFEKYNDMFFLVYTNGTLIDKELAGKLADRANVTPAISVEGFQKETDARRGPGTFNKILNAFDCLRAAGVPFGISVTATKENVDVLLKDEFYEYYFEKQGVCYMWQFQLMPVGRGKNEIHLMVTPEQRLKLYRKWEYLLAEKKYCIADFWNSGVLTEGCIAYGRKGGYFYIDWHGNITPCAFVPYYVDNIYQLYNNGKSLVDALFSNLMVNGRNWQRKYGLDDCKKPDNWLMPCSIRDHYETFINKVLTSDAKPEDKNAREALQSQEYFNILKNYDGRLQQLTSEIWQKEYLKKSGAAPVGIKTISSGAGKIQQIETNK